MDWGTRRFDRWLELLDGECVRRRGMWAAELMSPFLARAMFDIGASYQECALEAMELHDAIESLPENIVNF